MYTVGLAQTYWGILYKFFEIGNQYGPPAYGRRSILHPQFLRIRLAFTGAPLLDSWHSSSTLEIKLTFLSLMEGLGVTLTQEKDP